MNSCSRKDRISARTNRAVPSQLVSPITIMMFQIDGLRMATTVRIRKKAGNDSMTSMSPVTIVSTVRSLSGPTRRRTGP